MGSVNEQRVLIGELPGPNNGYLQKFRLYETFSNFYMLGRDKNRTCWRVLKIDRLEPTELNVLEDSTAYSEYECCDLLKRIHEGNMSTGGLKFVTTCYGVIGFVKFLGPYYMLLITKRRKIGAICGHTIYSITKSEMLPIPNPTMRSNMANSKKENRYKKLLCAVDLTKDFFFSYSYNVMHSLQHNLCNNEADQSPYETMFVWNEFLTRGIRNNLKNALWTIALVHGFFKQVKLSISGRYFMLTLIARRSRHYAGTRYLKRGVNEKGRVANDVETEQIVFPDVQEGFSMHISSVVQNRGSIPLFWSQETSRLNIKPGITLSKKDHKYEATKLHFENLVKRYGNPIIILNLIKTIEKKARESILRTEFANAIEFINKDLSDENHLKFLHWDLNKYSRNKATDVLTLLGKVAAYGLSLTGIFYCQVAPTSTSEGLTNVSNSMQNDSGDCEKNDDGLKGQAITRNHDSSKNCFKTPQLQKGVLRTNCIDCLDRTNVAQYAYGLVALGHQLRAVGLKDVNSIDPDSPLADDLMVVYETMGDTLAFQYGGSAAHNKIFQERRGQCKAATQSQELLRTIQRYYSNAYMDDLKQDAINVLLGYFQPQQGKPDLWELNSDQHYNVGRQGPYYGQDNNRSFLKRSLSEGNIYCEIKSPIAESIITKEAKPNQPFPDLMQGGNNGFSESSPEMSTCESVISCSMYIPSKSRKHLFMDTLEEPCLEKNHNWTNKNEDPQDCSNFLDLEWLSSSGNSCEEETDDRTSLINSSALSMEDIVKGLKAESTTSASDCDSHMKGREHPGTELTHDMSHNNEDLSQFSDSFVKWVNYGETLGLPFLQKKKTIIICQNPSEGCGYPKKNT